MQGEEGLDCQACTNASDVITVFRDMIHLFSIIKYYIGNKYLFYYYNTYATKYKSRIDQPPKELHRKSVSPSLTLKSTT